MEYDPEEVCPIEHMKTQLEFIKHISPQAEMKARLLAYLPPIREAANIIMTAVTHKELLDSRPDDMDLAHAEAILFNNTVTEVIMAILSTVKDEVESKGIGCFRAKSRTVESPPIDELPDVVNMNNAEIWKLLNNGNDEPIN